ncbi:methylmalonyl-CoA epimerase [Dehalococcoidia bacterium]|nr:methylmalonyl-CoA epimerase [Dehalococcoidia bacterium]MCL0078795.1 methylmalonyl-CoA epimerase [Dehalococcoidia bacterium]MCL0093815.1 methylmalonyl-CoA epimerase [Dehalococcoidia bacterium]MCL0097893.1 methylmalonyl-CoA epimerase [Dehalococcoidia bacterium]
MIKRIDHVAIAVKNLDQAVSTFENLFGLRPSRIEDIPDQGVRAAVIHIGDTELEFIEPVNPTSGVARFLESKGEGIHHICLEVDDTDEELKRLDARGARLIDKQGRKGLAGKIGFIHPKSLHGVLIELAQKT